MNILKDMIQFMIILSDGDYDSDSNFPQIIAKSVLRDFKVTKRPVILSIDDEKVHPKVFQVAHTIYKCVEANSRDEALGALCLSEDLLRHYKLEKKL